MKHELAQLTDKIDWRHYDSDDIDGVNPATGLAEGRPLRSLTAPR
jgi:hypothetical protein